MKSKRAIIMLTLSVLLGIAAVLLAARWMGEKAASDNTTVLVASSDMELGQAITPTMLQSVPWPKGAVPAGAFPMTVLVTVGNQATLVQISESQASTK